jgi:hypothetical protein
LKHGLSSDLHFTLKSTTGKIATRQPARFVHDIDKNSRAIGPQAPFRLGAIVGLQGFDQFLGTAVKKGLIGYANSRNCLTLGHNELESLACHHYAEAGSCGVPAGRFSKIFEDHAGVTVAIFSGHTRAGDVDFFLEALVYPLENQ